MVGQQFIGLLLVIFFTSKDCDSQSLVCGRASLNTRIVGGVEASPGSWPWIASISHNGDYHVCGGSLINNQWVMTAAHCIGPWFDEATIVVYLGRHNYSNPNPHQVGRNVSSIRCHPMYDDLSYENDICLLKLQSAVSFTPYIQPICLAARGSTLHSGVSAWVAGWGVTKENGFTFPTALQEVSVPIVGDNQCKCSTQFYVPGNTLCAGLEAGGKDACQGDSGGPLVIKQNSIWVQAGIVSLGDGCGRANTPGIYSEVSEYQEWIESVIESTDNEPGFVNFTTPGEDSDEDFICTTTTSTTTTSTSPTTPNTTTSMNTNTSDNMDESKGVEGKTEGSLFDSGENTKAHLSQLLSLCGFALSLFVLG